jgi:putative cell wall-binding protein
MSALWLARIGEGGWQRLLAGLAILALVGALAPAAMAGSHDDAGGPPDDAGPPGGDNSSEDTGGPPAERGNPSGGNLADDPEGITRITGANRFFTSAALSQFTHPDGADEVFVATGGDFADALAGAAAAAMVDAPVLFTPPGNLMPQVADVLVRLDPECVTVLGGPAAVSPRIMDQIDDLLGGDGDGDGDGVDLVRLGGGNRFGTAVAISKATHPDGADEVFLATGGRFPDALAGAPVAASLEAPVLLATSDSLPQTTTAELARLDPQSVTVLGGPGAISDDVLDQVEQTTGAETQRIGGSTRFDTAIAASQFLTTDDQTATAYVATGLGWADALAGAAAAGSDAAPVLLTTPGQLPDAVGDELRRLAPEEIVVLGGPGAVTSRVAQQVVDALDGG